MKSFDEQLLERGLVPDPLIRLAIRQRLQKKISDEKKSGLEFGQARFMDFIHKLNSSPIAVDMPKANEQHYELPAEFFKFVLGKHMKYSSGYWREGVTDFDRSEHDMLEITAERADLRDGQLILELGCGWGSLSLYLAQKFPKAQIIGVSNSRTQKEYIDAQAKESNIKNVEIITADMNTFQIGTGFDRVVSVEMFEHMRNYQELLRRVADFLNSDGKLFIHIFTHRDFAYFYEDNDPADWIAKYFFTGGIMPSDQLLLYFQDHFKIENHWRVCGTHYQKTAEGWLKNMDAHRNEVFSILQKTYGQEYKKWWVYWRIFFLACAELWGYENGTQWSVSHYLFKKR